MSRAPSLQSRRGILAGVLLALAFGLLAFTLHRHIPLGRWLFFHYLRATALAAMFCLCCVVAGHALLLRVLRRSLPFDEHLAIAFPLGVLCFYLLSFGCGVLGLYGMPFFVLAPAVLLWAGWRPAQSGAHRVSKLLKVWSHPRRFTTTSALLLVLGLGGLALLWSGVLTPRSASVDARWYHLPIAEHYIARGAIRPFSEGWVPGALPQLASLLYVWPLSAPGPLFDQVEGAAHLELFVFLFTLQGISALTRKVAGVRMPLAWTAIWLFPGIYCYDSGLVMGADHIAALWAAPLALLALSYWRTPSPRLAILLGAMAAGALSTKYTAFILLPLPLATALLRATLDFKRGVRGAWLAPALLGVTLLLLTAPHWLKNLAFYGDPLFPVLRAWLPSSAWSEAAEAPFRAWYALRAPSWSASGLIEMLRTLLTFAFVPHDFAGYHGSLPVFGFLFTLLTPLLLLLTGARRLVWLFGAAYAGLACWFWLHQYDRYLQALVPWMTAGVAALIGTVWRTYGRSRGPLTALIALQVVWGADIAFMPSHRGAGGSLPKAVADLLASAHDRSDRLVVDATWQGIAQALPRDARVLVHEEEIHLGLSRQALLDSPGEQGLLYWGEPDTATPDRIWQRLRAHGATHLVWAERVSHEYDTVAGALAFFEFATRHGKRLGKFGGFVLAEMPRVTPPPREAGLVGYFPCGSEQRFEPGLYQLPALARAPGDARAAPRPIATPSPAVAFSRARYLVYDARCHGPLPSDALASFELMAARGHAMLLLRKETP